MFQNQVHKIFKTTQAPEKLLGGTPKQARHDSTITFYNQTFSKINKQEKAENKAEPTKLTASASKFSSGQPCYAPSHKEKASSISTGDQTRDNGGHQTHDGREFPSPTFSQHSPDHFLKISSILNYLQTYNNGASLPSGAPGPLLSDAGYPGVPDFPGIFGSDISPSGDAKAFTPIPNPQTHDGREFSSPTFSRHSSSHFLKIPSILNDSQACDNGASLPSDGGDAPEPLSSGTDYLGVPSSSSFAGGGCPSVPGYPGIFDGVMSPSGDAKHDGRESSSPTFLHNSINHFLKVQSILNGPQAHDDGSANAFTLIPNSNGRATSSPTFSILNGPQILPPVPQVLNNLINNNLNEPNDVSLAPILYKNSTPQQILFDTLEPKPNHKLEDLDHQMKSSLFFSFNFMPFF
ncbi:hypothetical protein RclHR1_02310005 [Rhizophagus clarus]|uniref:Uncharacterized protein n=1 Tax=Rhizophagus clarus TaxID=94130 RepID=A0A2Z6R8X5_9GLOM|nr:hypothetical protein RclHR1_02310005 [Rhizophagus clarus]GES73342.1 hypothetical protein GLOIN_2v1597232 [Rhizophagus clarus]